MIALLSQVARAHAPRAVPHDNQLDEAQRIADFGRGWNDATRCSPRSLSINYMRGYADNRPARDIR